MNTRSRILLLIFSFSLFMLWDAWHRFSAPSIASEQGRSVTSDTSGLPKPSAALKESRSPSPATDVLSTAKAAVKDEVLTVQTDLLSADISLRGGDLVRVSLKQYSADSGSTDDFELLGAEHRYVAQTGLLGKDLPNHKSLFRVLGTPSLSLGKDDPSLVLRLEGVDKQGVKAIKTYRFNRNSYQINVGWIIENTGTEPLSPNAYFQIQRDMASPSGESKMMSTFTGPAVYTDEEKYQKISFGDLTDGKVKLPKVSNNGWLAMVQHHFVTAWVPQGNADREFYTRSLERDLVSVGLITAIPSIEPGHQAEFQVPLYVGPQEQARLSELAPSLELVVDYGWLTIIAAPIFWALEWLYKLVGNWGWSIVLLTIGIKLVFFPLSAASYRSMARMRTVTPRLMQIKERFADDKQRLNQEMMALYKTEKINPLGGCLPILVQIPVFIALYWVLLGAVEMRGAPWALWVKDLASPDPYYVLPVIMMASMFLQMRLNPTPPDPVQAKVMMIMPLVFGVMFFFFPAGLVLYWVVNNILSIAQQWQINRVLDSGSKPHSAANDD